ncbi:MAG: metal-dependent hydrolase [Halanaeroarchaeum sp.]
MMSTTHAAMGATVAALFAPVAPELAAIAAFAAIAGGAFPDLDVFFEHRKTLHYPEGYWLLPGLLLAVASAWPGNWTVAAVSFVGSAALHSATDASGGGLGLRPWDRDDDRGVYVHRRGRWIRPRRWVRYDGAPEDLLAAATFSVLPILVFEGAVRRVLFVALGASMTYTAVRKRLPDAYERLV